MAELTLASAVAAFGRDATGKLASVAARGEPEDQLRNPFENLVRDLAQLCGRNRSELTLVGEVSMAALKTRPDFAVSYRDALIGHIELKAPHKGADPRRFRDAHDKQQWERLKVLPNLLYSSGDAFSLWRGGELVGRVVTLDGDIEAAGGSLSASDDLLALFSDFLEWSPIAPRSAQQLAETSAQMCRLLRFEVVEQLASGSESLRGLASDWGKLLFPDATDDEFADGYAQAVTFGLLLARAQDISLERGVETAAKTLADRRSVIGAALRLLVEVTSDDTLKTSTQTMARVLSVVDWPTISRGDPDAWLYFYEDFLDVYDKRLRKRTGSYYTPVPVVKAMAGLVEEVLRDRFGLVDGLADPGATIVDPAMGTGTFLLEIQRRIAEIIAADQGDAVAGAVASSLRRMIGFELQLGPFAVAQLRLLAELGELGASDLRPDMLRTYVTNTLGNPYVEEQSLGVWYEPIAKARREADRIKRDEAVLVVLGNPPYKDKSKGKGAWVESGVADLSQPAPLADFVPPAEWGVGAHVKHLYNPYVYFWRWATWKVFDNHPDDKGVICFISVAGFVDGPGFQRMREYLRRRSDEIWVVDCTPEGHQPPINTRVFQDVQQPVCIMLAVRDGSTGPDVPAPVRFRALAKGHRDAKFTELTGVSLGGEGWADCPTDWRAPFLPAGDTAWTQLPGLDDLLCYSGSGTMPGRTWVVAPDAETLEQRWDTLIHAKPDRKPVLMTEHPTDRRVDTVLSDNLPGFPATSTAIKDETSPCPKPVAIGFRSFDRQWIVPDKRLINRPNPTLWSLRSKHQVYLTVPHDTVPTGGPAGTFTGDMPDLHHYKGSFGGRAYPLWLDATGERSNAVPGLVEYLVRSTAGRSRRLISSHTWRPWWPVRRTRRHSPTTCRHRVCGFP